jgi:predicted Fe-S protein YdhL (DUF1289 family)
MSIAFCDGAYTPTCDGCLETLTDVWDFYDAVDAAKAAAWRSVKADGDWENYCPGCTRKLFGAAADFADVGNTEVANE